MHDRSRGRRPLGDELPAELRRFTEALRETTDSVPLTQSRIADKAGAGEAAISGYLNGNRVPEQGKLEKIYKVLEEAAQRTHTELPYCLGKLLSMRAEVLRARIERSVGGDIPVLRPVEERTADSEQPAPRVSRAARRSRRRRRITPLRGRVSPLPTRDEVPVPSGEGDRHLIQDSGPSRAAELDAYRSHQAAGRTRDAYMILWSMANALPVREFPAVVMSYRAAGLAEAAETLLHTAARREVQAALNIAAALHDNDQYEDAGVILNAARTDS
ncbi:helix-turn-helix transcriptional regulator [Streptomyces sp. NBC_00878]|uniref:helix-turn-helix domain-containing protein n=1 Tax=Streptomyces sp. NBC_00878 TaxID=2975854 RepID=UPI00225385B1|nr:hypothetical protein [Streptomyces sp. NBC_00878]MCX4908395.1 hypothetical protein [Streptomyces sp. NBC_00878]